MKISLLVCDLKEPASCEKKLGAVSLDNQKLSICNNGSLSSHECPYSVIAEIIFGKGLQTWRTKEKPRR